MWGMRAGTLLDSPKYKNFVSDRDKTLEQIHLNAQTDISRILFSLLDQLKKEIAYIALYLTPDNGIQISKMFDKVSQDIFHSYVPKFIARIQSMRKATYLLTYLAEQEAIGQATQKKKPQTAYDMKLKIRNAVSAKTLTGQDLDKRVWASLMSLHSKIMKRFRNGIIQNMKPKELLDEVILAFPNVTVYKRPPRELTPFREADQDPKNKSEFNFDFTDQSDWDDAVDAYKKTELPENRFDQGDDTNYSKYDWELEQDLTDDFVNQVRNGQVDAANELGINDGVWTAVIDKKTCETCCLPRNGKTTTEIKQMLASGELDADDCDATNPPGHSFCRCQWAPVSSTDEVEGPDWKSFNDWLES